jgi:hypothetical protein
MFFTSIFSHSELLPQPYRRREPTSPSTLAAWPRGPTGFACESMGSIACWWIAAIPGTWSSMLLSRLPLRDDPKMKLYFDDCQWSSMLLSRLPLRDDPKMRLYFDDCQWSSILLSRLPLREQNYSRVNLFMGNLGDKKFFGAIRLTLPPPTCSMWGWRIINYPSICPVETMACWHASRGRVHLIIGCYLDERASRFNRSEVSSTWQAALSFGSAEARSLHQALVRISTATTLILCTTRYSGNGSEADSPILIL